MNKELTALEYAIIVLTTMVIVGFWIWIALVFWRQDTMQFAKVCVMIMAAITFAVLCALWSLAIESHVHEKRRAAWMHVIDKTRGVYFYGYPLSDCLCSNVATELCRHRVGDFSRTLGFIVLCALKDDKKNALMYTRRVESTPGHPEYNDSIIRFYYKGECWQFSLNRPLNDARRLTRVRLGSKKSSLLNKGYRSFDFWIMPREWRLGIGRCADPKKAFFYPDINYADMFGPDYKNLVQNNIEKALRTWRWCESNSLRLDRLPQHVAA